MKIGITTFGGDGGKSGISRYIINILKAIDSIDDENEYEVLVFEDEKQIFTNNLTRITPVSFGNNLRNPIANIAWHQFDLGRLCKRRNYDLLFLPAGNRRLPFSVDCPTVGVVHDFSSLHVKGKYDKYRLFYITKILPVLIRNLTKVITISESSKKDILEFAGIPENRISVIPLAADNYVYFPRGKDNVKAEIKKKYGLDKPYILYISRIEHPGKNHLRLIRAFESVKDREKIPHRLVLAGSDWNGAEEVHHAAESSKYSADIVFTGFISQENLPDIYCGADLFVFPSLYEGFGLPVLEAFSSGIPVACSNSSSLPEVAGNAAAFFNPYDKNDIANSITRLITNKSLSNTYAQRGLDRSKEFSWASTARQTIEVFKMAVGSYSEAS